MQALERVKNLIFDIKKSPKYGADIMHGFVARNGGKRVLDISDSRCLINMSNLFYDNLYMEEIQGSPLKQPYFVLAFKSFVDGITFEKDAVGNVVV